MKFVWPVGFEIPDALWIEAGMLRFRPRGSYYRCAPTDDQGEMSVPISAIEPPVRSAGTPFFSEDRLREILRAFAADDALPPIEVFVAPRQQYRYRVRDGFHRFYAAAAAGYPQIPIKVVEPPFEFETPSIPRTGA